MSHPAVAGEEEAAAAVDNRIRPFGILDPDNSAAAAAGVRTWDVDTVEDTWEGMACTGLDKDARRENREEHFRIHEEDILVAVPRQDTWEDTHTAEALQRERVVVAVDDVVARATIEERLEELGFRVERVEDGFSAIEAAFDLGPAALILERRLPVIDGLEACQILRSDPRAAEVVQLRFFAGLAEDEAAAALGLSARTVRREWEYAKAWLVDALRRPGG